MGSFPSIISSNFSFCSLFRLHFASLETITVTCGDKYYWMIFQKLAGTFERIFGRRFFEIQELKKNCIDIRKIRHVIGKNKVVRKF